jgi:signal transduction histidine kinase
MDHATEILDAVPIAYFYLDPDESILFRNQYAITLYGHLAEDCVGLHISNVFSETEMNQLSDGIRNVKLSGNPAVETFVSSFTNNLLQCSISSAPHGIILSLLDIDNSKLPHQQNELQPVEEQIRSSTRVLLRQAEQLADAGSWNYSLVHKSMTWSEGMYRLFNLDSHIGVHPEIYLEYATAESLITAARIVNFIESGRHDFEERIEINVAGQVKVLRLKAAIARDNNGIVDRVLGIDIDITAMRQAEDNLRYMQVRQQQEIFQVTLDAQESERRRISDSLQNGLAQLLYGIKLHMSYLTREIHGISPDKFAKSKEYTDNLLAEAITETRKISHELMPTVLAGFGLNAAIKELCGFWREGLFFQCEVTLEGINLSYYLELVVFRTVQELMINVDKHAEASKAKVVVHGQSNVLKVQVSDNGKGMPKLWQSGQGTGLSAIQRQVALLNGDLSIDSKAMMGTVITVHFPVFPFDRTQAVDVIRS